MTTEEKAALVAHAQAWIRDAEATRDEIPFGFDDDTEKELSLMKIALASLTAEPRGYIDAGTPRDEINILTENKILQSDIALYATPPAADSSNSAVIPDGWRLVPVEPTPAMMVAGTLVSEFQEVPGEMYRAMLAAAPTP